MPTETPRAGVALTDHTDGETPPHHNATSAAFEDLARQLGSLSAPAAKRAILRAKMRHEITLEQAGAVFSRRLDLRSA